MALEIVFQDPYYLIKGIKVKQLIEDTEEYLEHGKYYSAFFDVLVEGSFLFKKEIVKIHKFFLFELFVICVTLYYKTKKGIYAKYAYELLTNTHIKTLFEAPTNIDTLDPQYAAKVFKYPPKPYQEQFIVKYPYLKSKLKLRGYYLAFEQGLGKTFTSLYLMFALKKTKIVVVVPKALKINWLMEIEQLTNLDTEKQVAIVPEQTPTKDTIVVIVNYDQVGKLNNMTSVFSGQNVGVIIDEAHHYRFINTKRVQMLYTFVTKFNVTDVLPMSGTPIKGYYSEFGAALLLLDPMFDMTAYQIFAQVYSKSQIIGDLLLKHRLAYFLYRLKKSDVKDVQLPPKHYRTIEVPIDPKPYILENLKTEIQMLTEERIKSYTREYRQYLEQILEILDTVLQRARQENDEVLIKAIEQYVKLLYKASGDITRFDKSDVERFKHLQALILEKMSPAERNKFRQLITVITALKRKALGEVIGRIFIERRRDLLRKIYDWYGREICKLAIEQKEKVIIFTYLASAIPDIKEILQKKCPNLNVVVVSGDIPQKKRKEAIQNFKSDPNVHVLIATYKTLGFGVTLTESRYVILADLPPRDADLQQAVDRVHRIGQEREVYVLYLKLRTDKLTIQDRLEEILQFFKKMVEELIEKPVPPSKNMILWFLNKMRLVEDTNNAT